MEQLPGTDQKFTTRLTAFTEKRRLELASAASFGILPQAQHMILEDYLHISLIRRMDPLPLFKLQLNLVNDLVVAEKAISEYKQRKEERESKISAGATNKDELQMEIRQIEREIHHNKAECRAIRDIADGIAWRLFEYDRAVLSQLANRAGALHINLGGFETELHEFGEVFNSREGIAILNDLTHFLKRGDITIRKDTGTFEIVEVKTSQKRGGRITRQKQDLHRIIEFFNTGQRNEGDNRLVISELEIRPETFHANIQNLMAKAQKKGAVAERIGEHLIIECTDFTAEPFDSELLKLIVNKARDWAEEWRKRGDIVMDFWNQDKYLDVRNYAPYSVFPYPDAVRIKLITGALFLVAYVNISALLRYFEQKGWSIIKTPQQLAEEWERSGKTNDFGLAILKKGHFVCEIPWPWVGRMGFEFLKPRTIVDAMEASLTIGPSMSGLNIVNFSGESHQWD